MVDVQVFPIVLVLATLFVALATGFIFSFAIVTMPGISLLDDAQFIRAFQVMDGVIQNNQPVFVVIWAGSVLSLIAAGVLGFGQLQGVQLVLLIAAVLIYILGVQLPTVTINIPLNNELQSLDVTTMDADALSAARIKFEGRWNQSNTIRSWLAVLVSLLLMIVLLGL